MKSPSLMGHESTGTSTGRIALTSTGVWEFQQILGVFKSYSDSVEAPLRFAALFSLALPAVGCVHSVEPLVNFLIQTPGLVISLIFVLLIVFQCTTPCSGCRTVCIGLFGLRQA